MTTANLLQLIVIGLTNGAVIALNALAVTLIYSAARTLNLAHGDVFALLTVLVTTLVTALGLRLTTPAPALALGLLVGLAAAVGLGAGLSALIERLAFRPFRTPAGGGSRLAPLLATLGISFILYQAALIWRYFLPNWLPGEHRSVPGVPELPRDSIPEVWPAWELVISGVRVTAKDLGVVGLAIAAAVGVWLFLRHTRAGRAIRAIAQNVELARILGVDLDAAVRTTFLVGGGLAGLAAFVFATYYTHPFGSAGAQSGLIAFAAALLGGLGSPLGALAAGLGLGLAAAFSDYFLFARWTPVLLQGLLIVVLLLRPAAGADSDEDALPASPMAAGRARWLAWALLGGAAVYPFLDAALGWRWLASATSLGIYALLAVGLHLLLGVAGRLDLGYAVSFGVGGYVTALLTNRYAGPLAASLPQPLDFSVVLALSAGAAGLYGALIGRLTRRLRGDDLALVTLALGQIARQVLANTGGWLGEGGSVAAIPPPTVLTVALTAPAARYGLVALSVAVAAFASRRLIHSRAGRAWRALSADEAAAASLGVDPAHHRGLAFSLGAALAGAAGALFAASFSYMDPEALDFRLSVMVLAMVILGGAGGGPGVILAALVVGGYDRLVIPLAGAFLAQFQMGGARLGPALDVRGLSYLNFGLALYLTIWLRARRPRT